MAISQPLSKKERAPVDTAANYLLKRKTMMCYDKILAIGAPIASGVMEGACRHLMCDRLDITGARWRLASAEAVLRLRLLKSSGDFDAYWQFHEEEEMRRNHTSRYANSATVLRNSTLSRLFCWEFQDSGQSGACWR